MTLNRRVFVFLCTLFAAYLAAGTGNDADQLRIMGLEGNVLADLCFVLVMVLSASFAFVSWGYSILKVLGKEIGLGEPGSLFLAASSFICASFLYGVAATPIGSYGFNPILWTSWWNAVPAIASAPLILLAFRRRRP